MQNIVRIVLAQLDFLVGDIPGNTSKIISETIKARDDLKADMIVFPELSLCGYLPEDLLFRENLQARITKALKAIRKVTGIVIVIGLPVKHDKGLQNSAVVLYNGKVLCSYSKCKLPNHSVFDEERYFVAGKSSQKMTFYYKGLVFGIGICEDFWYPDTATKLADQKADILLSLNASPYEITKLSQRKKVLQNSCLKAKCPVVYVNLSGAQDELVFDGGSFVLNSNGETVLQADHFKEQLYLVDYDINKKTFLEAYYKEELSSFASTYEALKMGLKDYVVKNHFKNVVLGLSGGIDSALVLTIAVDALGCEKVEAVMMPYKYTSSESIKAAEEQVFKLGVKYNVLPIHAAFDGMKNALQERFKSFSNKITEENLQARCRGMLLMAISNEKNHLVLTTGNKSELSVGYATLYGDMAGGFCVLKDVPKTLVYKLAKWRNEQSFAIPDFIIERPPSAELAPNQQDQDSLPSYNILDEILKLYIEKDYSVEAIIASGFERETVHKVIRLVDMNEHKRCQAAIGVKITSRAFGKDRRYPITSGWQLTD